MQEMIESKPVVSADQWLGRNTHERRRLWERLNPRHRKQLRLLARALVLRQSKAQLHETLRNKLLAALDEFERLAVRIEQLLRAMPGKPPLPRENSHAQAGLPHNTPL
jgi:acyl-CoA reductase-like NAD-dependent aldehyde dehydrogenase